MWSRRGDATFRGGRYVPSLALRARIRRARVMGRTTARMRACWRYSGAARPGSARTRARCDALASVRGGTPRLCSDRGELRRVGISPGRHAPDRWTRTRENVGTWECGNVGMWSRRADATFRGGRYVPSLALRARIRRARVVGRTTARMRACWRHSGATRPGSARIKASCDTLASFRGGTRRLCSARLLPGHARARNAGLGMAPARAADDRLAAAFRGDTPEAGRRLCGWGNSWRYSGATRPGSAVGLGGFALACGRYCADFLAELS